MQLLESFKFSLEQLPKLNEDQLRQLKDCMFEHPGHFILKKLQQPQFNNGIVDYEKIGKTIISALVDIAAKKLPSDLPFSNKQLDQIIQKVKFVPVPKTVVDVPVFKEEVVDASAQPPKTVRTLVQDKNTNERAIVRIRVPRRRIEEEFV